VIVGSESEADRCPEMFISDQLGLAFLEHVQCALGAASAAIVVVGRTVVAATTELAAPSGTEQKVLTWRGIFFQLDAESLRIMRWILCGRCEPWHARFC